MKDDVPPSSRCKSCGACCKALPGQFYPEDLGADEQERRAKATEMLRSGRYAIDWYEGDPFTEEGDVDRVLHLRPAVSGDEGKIFDPSWGGRCTFLGDKGCTLERGNMPTVCKALVPIATNCTGLTKHDVAVAWYNDSDWLEAVGIAVHGEKA